MPKRPTSKKISASQGAWYGFMLLGQVTGILVASTLVGWLIDTLFGSGPFGLAGSVIIGSLAATGIVVGEAYKVTK